MTGAQRHGAWEDLQLLGFDIHSKDDFVALLDDADSENIKTMKIVIMFLHMETTKF